MAEQVDRRWRVGQAVNWPNVEPYTIAHLVDSMGAGNIHIAEGTGRFHVYWHREQVRGDRVISRLVHHGGPLGFEDLYSVKRQHERILLRYFGIKLDIPARDQEEGVSPEVDFPQLAEEMEVEIPGEQLRVGEWVATLQRINRDITEIIVDPRRGVVTQGHMSRIREGLKALLEGNLGRSINRFKKAAAASIAEGLEMERAGLLAQVNEAQMQLLLRAQQIVSITLGTMQRYNSLESLQSHYQATLDSVVYSVGRAAKVLRDPSSPEDQLERFFRFDILGETTGLRAKLEVFKGQPHLDQAQRFIDGFSPVAGLWNVREKEMLAKLFADQVVSLEAWRRRSREEMGINFGRYNLLSV